MHLLFSYKKQRFRPLFVFWHRRWAIRFIHGQLTNAARNIRSEHCQNSRFRLPKNLGGPSALWLLSGAELNGNFSDSCQGLVCSSWIPYPLRLPVPERQCCAQPRASHANFRTRLALFWSSDRWHCFDWFRGFLLGWIYFILVSECVAVRFDACGSNYRRGRLKRKNVNTGNDQRID